MFDYVNMELHVHLGEESLMSKKTHLILIHFSEVFHKISIDSYAET